MLQSGLMKVVFSDQSCYVVCDKKCKEMSQELWEGNCHQLIYSDKYININYTIISTQIMYDFLFPLFFTGPTIPMLGQYFTVSFQSLVFLLKLHLPHLNYKICLLSEQTGMKHNIYRPGAVTPDRREFYQQGPV